MRRRRVRGEERGRLVPRALDLPAFTEAGLVAARDQDHPRLRAGGGRGGRAGRQGGLPVVVGERDDVLRGDGGGAGGDGGGECSGEVGLGFLEVGLEVEAEEAQRLLVLREGERCGKEEEGGGEAHCGGLGIECLGMGLREWVEVKGGIGSLDEGATRIGWITGE